MKTMMLLGLGALVAVVFLVLFMTGELKNKSTFSSDGHVNFQGSAVARLSIDEDELYEGAYNNLHSDDWRAKEIVSNLYAHGGGYNTYVVPYVKDEDLQFLSSDKKITNTKWVEDYEKKADTEKVDTELLTKIDVGQHYYAPYTMKKSTIHKETKHMRHMDNNWDKEEEKKLATLAGTNTPRPPHKNVVSNHHNRHQAAAKHGEHN